MIAAVSTFQLDVLLGWRFLLIKTRQKLCGIGFFFIIIFDFGEGDTFHIFKQFFCKQLRCTECEILKNPH